MCRIVSLRRGSAVCSLTYWCWRGVSGQVSYRHSWVLIQESHALNKLSVYRVVQLKNPHMPRKSRGTRGAIRYCVQGTSMWKPILWNDESAVQLVFCNAPLRHILPSGATYWSSITTYISQFKSCVSPKMKAFHLVAWFQLQCFPQTLNGFCIVTSQVQNLKEQHMC